MGVAVRDARGRQENNNKSKEQVAVDLRKCPFFSMLEGIEVGT